MSQASVWYLCIQADVLRSSGGVAGVDGGLGAAVVGGELGASKSTTCAPGGTVDLILAFFRLRSSLSEFPSLALRFEGLAPRRRNFKSKEIIRC